MVSPPGEDLKVGFDGSLNLEFHGARITSDAGLLAYRDLDETLGLFALASRVLNETRTGRNIQHDMRALLRQSVYSRLGGYEDVNDADRLSIDPAIRAITWKLKEHKNAASANTMGLFETEMLGNEENLRGLEKINGGWVQKGMKRTAHRRIILDMDSSESPVHGEQEGSAYNGHFGCSCYHPLFCLNQFGDCEGAMLRPGNVHSAERWKELLAMINPVNHARYPEAIATYKVEPYVVSADVYALSPHTGRGGWTWYTGSAGWMYRLIVESLLGLRLEVDKLHVAPCLPVDWEAFKVHYRYRETLYHIDVLQTREDKGGASVTVDGVERHDKTIPLIDDRQEHSVEVRIPGSRTAPL